MAAELGDTILERVFETVDKNGQPGTVKLRVGLPFQVSAPDSELKWRCPYEIIGLGSETIKNAPGIDAIDAILRALRFAESFLKSYIDLYTIKITWLGEDWLGFPFEKTPEQDMSSIDENSPFKKAFDEFFANLEKNLKDKPSP